MQVQSKSVCLGLQTQKQITQKCKSNPKVYVSKCGNVKIDYPEVKV